MSIALETLSAGQRRLALVETLNEVSKRASALDAELTTTRKTAAEATPGCVAALIAGGLVPESQRALLQEKLASHAGTLQLLQRLAVQATEIAKQASAPPAVGTPAAAFAANVTALQDADARYLERLGLS